LKVVFDTNIYISAFVIPGGNAEKAYIHAIDGDFELCTSVAILTELARKLDEKFGWEKQKIAQLNRVPLGCSTGVSSHRGRFQPIGLTGRRVGPYGPEADLRKLTKLPTSPISRPML